LRGDARHSWSSLQRQRSGTSAPRYDFAKQAPLRSAASARKSASVTIVPAQRGHHDPRLTASSRADHW
jgi:hypothetical protein